MKKFDVIIIGAGLSGLAAGIEIAQTNKSYVIIEKSGTVGGKVVSTDQDGFILDEGFHVMLPSYPLFSKLRISIPHKIFNRSAIIYKDNRFLYVGSPFLKMPKIVLEHEGKNICTMRDGLILLKLALSHSYSDTNEVINSSGLSEKIKEYFLYPFLRGILLDYSLKTPWSVCSFYLRHFIRSGAALPDNGIRALPLRMSRGLHIEKHKVVEKINAHEVYCSDGSIFKANKIIVSTPDIPAYKNSVSYHSTSCFYFSVPKSLRLEKNLVLFPDAKSGELNHVALLSEVNPTYSKSQNALLSASTVGTARVSPKEIQDQLMSCFSLSNKDIQFIKQIDVEKALPNIESNLISLHQSRNTELDGIIFCGDTYAYGSQNGALLSGHTAAHTALRNL